MKRRKSNCCLVPLLIALFMMETLMGCAAKSEDASITTEVVTENVEETVKAEVAKGEESTPVPTAEPAPKPTPEPTPHPTPELIVYEGIDMESTLPGVDWIATFEGIISEPKIVIFNDETNKKIIVENEERVIFEEGDVFALYVPEYELVEGTSGIYIDKVDTEYMYTCHCLTLKLNEEILNKIEGKGNEFTITFHGGKSVACRLVPEFD